MTKRSKSASPKQSRAVGWRSARKRFCPPLRVINHGCSYVVGRVNCLPLANWNVKFNNFLASDFDPTKIRVEPELAGLKVSHFGDAIIIEGNARPRTAYRVILDASITDFYGQTLGQPVTLNFTTGPMEPSLSVSGSGLVTLDPAGQKRISIYSVNQESLRVALYAVTPEDYGRFASAMRARLTYQRNNPPPFPEIGRRVFADTIKINAQPDEIAVTPIDLRPALREGFGHALLIVERTAKAATPYNLEFITATMRRCCPKTQAGGTTAAVGRSALWLTRCSGTSSMIAPSIAQAKRFISKAGCVEPAAGHKATSPRRKAWSNS